MSASIDTDIARVKRRRPVAGFTRQAAHLIYGSKTRYLGGRFGGCRTGLKLTIFART
jgi:hypothetical protein